MGKLARLAVITFWLLVFAVVYAAGRTRAQLVEGEAERRLAIDRLRGQVLRRLCTRLGATFVKLGQVLSSRPDLLPPALTHELRALQDRLPAVPFAEVQRVIEEDLGTGRFVELDPEPLAAASVAQVHRGRLADGREVAVKVLRPDIRRRTQRDAALLRDLARMVAWHPEWKLSQPEEHVAELVAGIVKQTDLTVELHNNLRLARNLGKRDARVRVPGVVPELCSSRVLTMELVRGVKVDELGPGHEELGLRLQKAVLEMCFTDGFVHADLHPGNLFFQPEGDALVLLDLGLCKALDGEIFEQFVDFGRCIAMGGPDDFVRHLRRFHRHAEGTVDWQEVHRDLEAFVGHFRRQSVGELEVGAFFEQVLTLARKHRLRPLPDIVLVMVGLATCEGIGKRLNPEGNAFVLIAGMLAGRVVS